MSIIRHSGHFSYWESHLCETQNGQLKIFIELPPSGYQNMKGSLCNAVIAAREDNLKKFKKLILTQMQDRSLTGQ